MKKVNNICIVGGGSAGWMTAGLLTKNLPSYIKVTLIESPNIPTVGVGEATLVSFRNFMLDCGFHEDQWIDEVDGLYKCGIKFEDWVRKNHIIWHPFANLQQPSHDLTSAHLYKKSVNNSFEEFCKYCVPNYTSIIKHEKVDESNVGYHVDAAKLARFFINNVKDVNHILGHVQNVNVENSEIVSIDLDNDLTIEADLFIDCTGFRNLVSSNIEGADWVSKTDFLGANCAIAAPVKYEDKALEMKPFTTSKCLDIGWMWITPVQSRIGSGIVFNKDITPVEEAMEVYDSIWGKDRRLKDFNVIPFEPRYNKRSWRSNVVSIGLSSGFVEPLESSGLEIIIQGASVLLSRIRKGYFIDSDADFYNSRISFQYEETFNFIQLHYLNSEIESKYWDFIRNKPIQEELKLKIEYYKDHGLQFREMAGDAIFAHHSWVILMEAAGFDGGFTSYISDDVSVELLNNWYRFNELLAHENRFTNYELLNRRKSINNFQGLRTNE